MAFEHGWRSAGLALWIGLTVAAGAASAATFSIRTTTANLATTGGTIYLPPPPPPETVPLPPYGTGATSKTTHGMSIAWRDDSRVESGYRVERRVGTGAWTVVARLGPVASGIGEYRATGLSANTTYCYRVVPWNAYGEPASVPAPCTTTNALANTSTVVVRDRIGLIGELAEPTAPPFQPSSLTLSADPGGTTTVTTTASSGLRIPTAVKTIYVADDAVIDLTYMSGIVIPSRITLASGRGGLRPGALLYSNTPTAHTLFEIGGDQVRVTGLRFRGPTAGTSSDLPNSNAIRIRNARDVLIDHNEFSAWPGAGVSVSHAPGLMFPLTAFRLHITENYFHHNQRQNGGYGVVVSDASYAFIDENTFDWNRHAIASDGGRNAIVDPSYGPTHGYLAYRNLILPGHADQEYVGGIWEQQTHHFDVHGSESNWLGVDYYDGWAGEFFDIADNSFLGIKGTAFNIRGTPSNTALFHHNVTPLPVPFSGTATLIGLDGGVSFYGWWSVNSESDRENVDVYGNRPSRDPRERLAVGDFDGDGREDVLLLTGRAWYVSYGGITEWRFLRASDRILPAVSLADLDGNGRTDAVVREGGVDRVSWNGTGGFVALGWSPALPSQQFYAGGDLIGDFDGDDILDRMTFDPDGDDRRFRITDGRTGAVRFGRAEM